MSERISFDRVHILVADRDEAMATLLQNILHKLGIVNVSCVQSGKAAVQMLHLQEMDILFTEWDLEHVDGISLVESLRQSEIPQLRMLPVVMLSARAAKQDAITARDCGVSEYLLKPYTAHSLFNSLQNIVDFPRDFIISREYTGPDRRLEASENGEDKRTNQERVVREMPKNVDLNGPPIRILAKRSLAEKFGLDSALRDLVTVEMLEQAQRTIESFRDESVEWMATNVQELENAAEAITQHADETALDKAKEELLSIKSRAGTFSFKLAAQVAYDLYKFLRNDFELKNDRHNLIIIKHVEVVKVLLAQRVTGDGGRSEATLMEGLHILMRELNRPGFYDNAA